MTGPTDPALRMAQTKAYNKGWFDGHTAAAEAAPLDVERLAEYAGYLADAAEHAVQHMRAEKFYCEDACNIEHLVPKVREYAALRSPDSETAAEAGDGL